MSGVPYDRRSDEGTRLADNRPCSGEQRATTAHVIRLTPDGRLPRRIRVRTWGVDDLDTVAAYRGGLHGLRRRAAAVAHPLAAALRAVREGK